VTTPVTYHAWEGDGKEGGGEKFKKGKKLKLIMKKKKNSKNKIRERKRSGKGKPSGPDATTDS